MATDNLGFQSAPSEIQLNVQTRPPANDDFTNRTGLTGSFISVTASPRGATREAGETNYVAGWSGGTVWWSWTAPMSGTAILTAQPFSYSRVNVYSGNDLSGLNIITSATSDAPSSVLQLTFDAHGGETYQLSVGGGSSDPSFPWNLFLDSRYIDSLSRLQDGSIKGRFITSWDESWIVEASNDLVDWNAIATNAPANSSFEFQDTLAPGNRSRFYRVKAGP
jgi:hypothetical protein